MIGFLTVIHVLVCLLLIVSILLQSSKGGGLAGMFGGGGMGGVFGGRGASSFLAKVTMWLGIGFGITSLTIALLRSQSVSAPKSALEQVMDQSAADALPAIPSEDILLPSGNDSEEFPEQPVQ